jgi:hypothetical protein
MFPFDGNRTEPQCAVFMAGNMLQYVSPHTLNVVTGAMTQQIQGITFHYILLQ